MELLPTWTKASSWSLGRDPLGFQATSVRIYRNLIPGLTNVTNRLRYYSFYCWIIERYEALEHSGKDSRWRSFIRRSEALYALACNLADQERADGLAGNIWANATRQELVDGRFDVRPFTDFHEGVRQYLGAPRGNFGQFYVASMAGEKFLKETTGIPLVDDLGCDMAAAFRLSIGKLGDRFLAAIHNGECDIDELRDIGHAIHPAEIPATSEEMTILRRFLLADNSQLESGWARRASCWILLDLFRNGVAVNDEAAIRRALYNGLLPGGSPYAPPGRTAQRWRAYQANELCHVALEFVLNALMARLGALSGGENPNVLVMDMLSPLADEFGLDRITWKDWAFRESRNRLGTEDSLAEPILHALDDTRLAGDAVVLSNAIKLLSVLWARWGSGDRAVRDEVEHFAAGNARSLAGVIRTFDEFAQSSARDALYHIVRRHIISNHLAIAGRKLSASGTFTYHFTYVDGLLSDPCVASYGYTNPRLRNLARFLSDARLHDHGVVTADGMEFLNACQPV